jgi:transcriptional regulator with XRE-family HTH domain
MNKISEIIKELREERKFSSKELAEKSGLSPAYISKLEKGNYDTISLKTSQQLSVGLGLTLKQLLEHFGLLDDEDGRGDNGVVNRFRSDGYTKKEAEEIMRFAEYVKQKNKK